MPQVCLRKIVATEPFGPAAEWIEATMPHAWLISGFCPYRAQHIGGQHPDELIEAVEIGGQPWRVAVQWHPELTAAEDRSQQKLFDELVENAKRI